jgi:small-conductance mechanosensitive channel
MIKDDKSSVVEKREVIHKRPIIVTFLGMIVIIILILVTLEVSHRNMNSFVASQQKYIIAVEAAILATFMVEMFGRLAELLLPSPRKFEQATRLRLLVRIIGYAIGSICVVSILASNATLGISAGAIAGVVIAFATQNILGSVIAAVLILNTRMVRVGEEIIIGQTKGLVSDINLTHTILSIDDSVCYVPNTLIVSSIILRKKRNSNNNSSPRQW